MKNPNSRPVPYKEQHDSQQDSKLRQHEADIAKLDNRPANKGGRG
jgi:hypothetical protein